MGFVYQGLVARTRQHFVLLVPGKDQGMDTSNIHTCTQICLTSNTHCETPYFLNLTNITIFHSLPNRAVTKLQYLWLLHSLPVRLMEVSVCLTHSGWDKLCPSGLSRILLHHKIVSTISCSALSGSHWTGSGPGVFWSHSVIGNG